MTNLKTNILITIDTEFSIGGYFEDRMNKPVPASRRIYCRINNKEYGIGMIMDILERYGLRGVFFVETESRHYFGDIEIIDIIRTIKERGHEVQLHIHPNFRTFKNATRIPDDMRRFSLDEQRQIIKEALEFLSEYGFDDCLAYRSGGFFSDLNTVKALKDNGLMFSSNYNIAFSNCSYIEKDNLFNDIFPIAGIYEVPVTCFREFKLRKEWNSFQISAASFNEMKDAMAYYHEHGINVITFITHSFEFVHSLDVQMLKMRPKHFIINRFEKLCRFIAENSELFRVITFRDLGNMISNGQIVFHKKSEPVFYESPGLRTLSRYFENFACSKLTV